MLKRIESADPSARSENPQIATIPANDNADNL
jgi:hypothetical protein